MKFLYLDKKNRIRSWFRPRRWRWAALGLATFLVLPLWRDSIAGRFILEASNRSAIRTQVAGRVSKIYVDEGQTVTEGSPVAQLRNLVLASKQAQTEADFRRSSAELRSAESRYMRTGASLTSRNQLEQQLHLLNDEVAQLELKTPITGIVMTPRVTDQLGSFVKEGTELAEVADIRMMRARIYISEYDLYKYRQNSSGRLQVDGMMGRWEAQRVLVSPTSTEILPGLIDLSKFKGMRSPTFYEMDIWVNNPDGRLKPGMVGTGRVYGRRQSVATFCFHGIAEFFSRKVW
jgi:multidrug efflux pump subunit AcrA (membrane-fusion protein)